MGAGVRGRGAGGGSAGGGGDLRERLRVGVAWSFLDSMLSRLGQLVVGIVLARLLSPRDFGVFAVALVAYTVIMSVNELGVSLTVVRAPAGEVARFAPTVTTLALASSGMFTVLCMATAPLLARALGSAQATGSLRVLALAIPVAGLTAVPAGLLVREFRQGARFAADAAAFTVSTSLGVWLAVTGHGPLALAWSRVAGNAASAVAFYLLVPRVPRPGFDRAVAREALAFGLPLAGSSLLIYGVLNVDYVVVGTVLGPAALGLYTLAFNLSSWPVNAFSTVARSVSMPAFARLLDTDHTDHADHADHANHTGTGGAAAAAFERCATLLMIVSLPVSVLLAVLAGPLITVVYGPKWSAAATPLVWLAWLGVLRVLAELAYDYLVAHARGRAILGVQLAWLGFLAPGLLVGAHLGGLAGVGAGHVAVASVVVLPMYLRVIARTGVRPARLARALARPLVSAGLAGGAALAAAGLVAGAGTPARLLAGGTAGAVTYLIAILPVLRPLLPARWSGRWWGPGGGSRVTLRREST
jgi:O-antigen/teichoic acid export membrane protein